MKISYVVGAVTSYEQFTGRSQAILLRTSPQGHPEEANAFRQVRQLLAAGHWLCAETEFADVAGTWDPTSCVKPDRLHDVDVSVSCAGAMRGNQDMFYHNGFRTTYSVSQKGEVEHAKLAFQAAPDSSRYEQRALMDPALGISRLQRSQEHVLSWPLLLVSISYAA